MAIYQKVESTTGMAELDYVSKDLWQVLQIYSQQKVCYTCPTLNYTKVKIF